MAEYVPESIRATMQDLAERAERAEAAAENACADYDRRGERLWRLAARAGWTPSEADNDAVAEMYIGLALDTLERGRALHEKAETSLAEIHQWAEQIADHYGDQWPHHGGCMGDPEDSGCPLCRILAATRSEP